MLNREASLWTFACGEGVEPTHNFMERLARVVQTCRLHEKDTLDYLAQAVAALRSG